MKRASGWSIVLGAALLAASPGSADAPSPEEALLSCLGKADALRDAAARHSESGRASQAARLLELASEFEAQCVADFCEAAPDRC